ncbi:MAG: hypothetical protein GY851_17345 [bacterium]|nr:hypothetical protein [bacterium]
MNKRGFSRRQFLTSATCASAALGASLAKQSAASGWEIRPRLYFTAQDVPGLRQRFDNDAMLRQARDTLLSDADKALTKTFVEESYAKGGSSQHGNYYAADRSASQAIETCAFAYVITGERRYAYHARDALLHFAKYRQWTGDSFLDRDPPWRSALETAHFTRAYALGIDWLADALSDEERRTACAALARLGVEPLAGDWLDPARRIHALDSMGHNWWMVCAGAAGLGAMTLLGEDDRADQWLASVVHGVPEFFRYPGNVLQNKPRNFDRAGGFYESLGYTDYTLRYYAYLQAALQHLFPEGYAGERFDALVPEIAGMDLFMLHFLYPRSSAADHSRHDFLTVDFGDHGRTGKFSGATTLFLAKATRNGRYRWYFDRYSRNVSGFYEMLFYDPSVTPEPPDSLSLSHALHDIGWASMRDTWDRDATLLAVKCGDTWNHAHADAGSFVLYAGGEPLLIDSGACSYGRPEYGAYYQQAKAHNTVLLDGRGPAREDIYRGAKFPGKVHSFLDAPGTRYVLADATGPFANVYRRFLRLFLWLDDFIVIYDDLLAHEPGHFEWLFHGEATPAFSDGRLTVEGSKARLALDVLYPAALDASTREGHAPKAPDTRLDYLALRSPEPAMDAKFLGVTRAGRELPELAVTKQEGDEWIGAQVISGTYEWDLYFNLRADGRRMHVNSNSTMDLLDTDAYCVAVRSGDHRRVLVIGASYLRTAEGVVVIDCLSKCNAVLDYAPDGEACTHAYIQAPEGSRVRLGASTVPGHVRYNGKLPSALEEEGAFVVVR